MIFIRKKIENIAANLIFHAIKKLTTEMMNMYNKKQ